MGRVCCSRADAAKQAFNRADALVSLAQGYLRGDRPHRSPIEITLTIPDSGLFADMAGSVEVAEMGESFLSRDVVRRLSCDAGVIEVVEGEHGTPLSVGRKRRTIAGALKRTLYKRDTTCTYPGCTHRIFLQGHHIKHWTDGVRPVCRIPRCRAACTIAMSTNTDMRSSSGRITDLASAILTVGWWPAVPSRPAVTDLGWPRIRAVNEPLAINAGTIACEWDGAPVDYGTIVGQLATVDDLR